MLNNMIEWLFDLRERMRERPGDLTLEQQWLFIRWALARSLGAQRAQR
jgi:hypothetical protein